MLSKKSVTSFLMSCALMMTFGASLQAQDMEDFKQRMADAAAMTKKDLSEALRQYLEIRILYAGPQVDYSLGRTYQRLYQCENAQYYYTQVMVAYDLPAEDATFSRAAKEYDTIATCDAWQKVYLTCAIPAGGYVMIDDQRINECWDRPFSLPDGDHTFKLVDADGKEHVVTQSTMSGGEDIRIDLAMPAQTVVEEKIVEVTKTVEYRDRFHPALYWGLISGGVLFLAGSGWFSAMANHALVDVQRWDDAYVITKEESAKKKADDARDKVKLGNTLLYTSIGIGSALAISGITLAIINAVSPKEVIEPDLSANITPLDGGVMMGFGLKF
jgi:hypothetical protein